MPEIKDNESRMEVGVAIEEQQEGYLRRQKSSVFTVSMSISYCDVLLVFQDVTVERNWIKAIRDLSIFSNNCLCIYIYLKKPKTTQVGNTDEYSHDFRVEQKL